MEPTNLPLNNNDKNELVKFQARFREIFAVVNKRISARLIKQAELEHQKEEIDRQIEQIVTENEEDIKLFQHLSQQISLILGSSEQLNLNFSNSDDDAPVNRTKKPASTATGVWIKPENISWSELVLKAIEEKNDWMRYSEIADQIGMPQEAKNNYRESITSSLNTLRGIKILGVPAYKKTKTGYSKVFFNGLPAFYETPEKKRIYEAKLKAKATKDGYLLEIPDDE